jgi:hypothetical protein
MASNYNHYKNEKWEGTYVLTVFFLGVGTQMDVLFVFRKKDGIPFSYLLPSIHKDCCCTKVILVLSQLV